MEELTTMIRAQQGPAGTDVWCAGEQLLEMAAADKKVLELLKQDLKVEEMSLTKAAKGIRQLADEKHKELKGNCVVVTPQEAETVLRKFYGLPDAAAKAQEPPNGTPAFLEFNLDEIL